jgi:predicted enzyme related to lactoylglutathione lyase
MMSIRNAIANVPVKNLKVSLHWYEKLVGRGPDRMDQLGMAEWIFEQGGRLQLHELPDHAGRGSLTFAVGNLDTEVAQLSKVGITGGEVTRTPAERTLVIVDPDGNTISLAEMLVPATHDRLTLAGSGDQKTHALERALERVATDSRLSPADVSKFLDSLILDLEALLRASEESMTGKDPGLAAQLLQRAHSVRDKIAARD